MPLPQDINLIEKISELVKQIYISDQNKKELGDKINQAIYYFYDISSEEIGYIKKSIARARFRIHADLVRNIRIGKAINLVHSFS